MEDENVKCSIVPSTFIGQGYLVDCAEIPFISSSFSYILNEDNAERMIENEQYKGTHGGKL